jgi:hypothetical protein
MSGNTREGAELGGLPGIGIGTGMPVVPRSSHPCTHVSFIAQMAAVFHHNQHRIKHHMGRRALEIAQRFCSTCI